VTGRHGEASDTKKGVEARGLTVGDPPPEGYGPSFSWPGNIRELENVIGNACMMVEGSLIDIDDLPESLRETLSDEASTDETFLTLEELQRHHILRVLQAVGGSKPRAAEILGIGRATIYQLLSRMKLKERNEIV
jgi:transcriptional regulator of acetoin/glycerol metabolism